MKEDKILLMMQNRTRSTMGVFYDYFKILLEEISIDFEAYGVKFSIKTGYFDSKEKCERFHLEVCCPPNDRLKREELLLMLGSLGVDIRKHAGGGKITVMPPDFSKVNKKPAMRKPEPEPLSNIFFPRPKPLSLSVEKGNEVKVKKNGEIKISNGESAKIALKQNREDGLRKLWRTIIPVLRLEGFYTFKIKVTIIQGSVDLGRLIFFCKEEFVSQFMEIIKKQGFPEDRVDILPSRKEGTQKIYIYLDEVRPPRPLSYVDKILQKATQEELLREMLRRIEGGDQNLLKVLISQHLRHLQVALP